MKSKTYDRIFEVLLISSRYSAVFLVIFAAWFITLAAFAGIFSTMSWSTYWVYGGAFVPSIITSVILISYKRAVDRYGGILWRDIWMGWATSVSYEMDGNTLTKCEKWIDENIRGLHRVRMKSRPAYPKEKITFVFNQKTDAMAFKLVWEEISKKDS